MNGVIKNIDKHFARLKRCLKNYHRFPGMEEIHSIRVEIKKIKAFFNAVHFYDKTFRVKRSFLPLRILFRRADEIREPGVMKSLVDRYEISDPVHFLTMPEYQLQKLQRALQTEMPFFIGIIKSVKDEIKNAARDIGMRDVKKYIAKKQRKVCEILTDKSTRKELHKCRKMAKEIIYLSGINKNLKKKLEPFYHEIEVAIGEWHDVLTLQQLLRKANMEGADKMRNILRNYEAHIHDVAHQFYH